MFQDLNYREDVTAQSHLVRSGLEYLGDRLLYSMSGTALMKVIPDRFTLYHVGIHLYIQFDRTNVNRPS